MSMGMWTHICFVVGTTDARKDSYRFVCVCLLSRDNMIIIGEKPFQCSTCGQLFGKKFHMTRHQRTHHDNEKEIHDSDVTESVPDILSGAVVEAVVEDVRRSRIKRVANERKQDETTDSF